MNECQSSTLTEALASVQKNDGKIGKKGRGKSCDPYFGSTGRHKRPSKGVIMTSISVAGVRTSKTLKRNDVRY